MKYSTIILAGAAVAFAQDLGSLPGCNQGCTTRMQANAVGFGCAAGDAACACSKTEFINGVHDCNNQGCPSTAQQGIDFVQNTYCKGQHAAYTGTGSSGSGSANGGAGGAGASGASASGAAAQTTNAGNMAAGGAGGAGGASSTASGAAGMSTGGSAMSSGASGAAGGMGGMATTTSGAGGMGSSSAAAAGASSSSTRSGSGAVKTAVPMLGAAALALLAL